MFGHGIDIFTISLNIKHGRQPLNCFKSSKWKAIGVIDKDLWIKIIAYGLIYRKGIFYYYLFKGKKEYNFDFLLKLYYPVHFIITCKVCHDQLIKMWTANLDKPICAL